MGGWVSFFTGPRIVYGWGSASGLELMRSVLHNLQLEASTHQGLEQQMPSFNLPSKILCKVVNVELQVGQSGHC